MVNLTRIYTRTGDDGSTALADFSRTYKTDARLGAYADVDEANAALGVLACQADLDSEIFDIIRSIQNDLFDVGADLATPVTPDPAYPPLRVTEEYISRLESLCDHYNAELKPLRSFILPGGTPAAAQLHVARTITRRAERSTWAAVQDHGDSMSDLPAKYLNRLSDLLFILSRYVNRQAGDVLWQPGERQGGKPDTSATSDYDAAT